jgi:kynurenine formamidase
MLLRTTSTLVLGMLLGAGATIVGQHRPATVTVGEYEAMFEANNNWGRWGRDDALGTMNLITNAKRKEAAALVRAGISVSLEHDLSTTAAPDNHDPLVLTFGPTLQKDTFAVTYHGTYVTHFDALCHRAYHGEMYNGRPVSMNTDHGCALGVEHYKNGIVTRGVLVDIPRLRGVRWLEPSDAIRPEEILAWERQTGVRIQPGDAVIIRTGRWARRAALGPWDVSGHAAGLDLSVLPLIHQRDVALLGGDTTAEVQSDPPAVQSEEGRAPFHTAIAWLGMPLIDDFDPEAAADVAARLHRWEFMFVVAPLSIPGGTGGPVNPIAVF